MTFAEQTNTFGTKHPRWNFIGGLAAGAALTAAATFGVMTQVTEGNVAAGGFVQSSITEESAAPRVAVAVPGVVVESSEAEVLAAERVTVSAASSGLTDEQTYLTEQAFRAANGVGTGVATADGGALDINAAAAAAARAAGVDQALFEGADVFNETRLGVIDGPTAGGALTDEQAYLIEADYRSLTLGIGSFTDSKPTLD